MKNLQMNFVRPVLAILALTLAGCAGYYSPRYAGHSSFYGFSAQPGRAYADPYARSHRAINPVHYPYWSLDHFYFSRYYYHPYSVFVGYRQPLYYPYPGWAYGPRYTRRGAGLGHGFGYPWQGFGRPYTGFSTGFFYSQRHSTRDRRHYKTHYRSHPIQQIDQRLRTLDRPETTVSRRDLLAESGRIDDQRPSRRPMARSEQDRAARQRASLRGEHAVSSARSRDADRPRSSDRSPDRSSGIPIESLRGRVRVIEPDRRTRASGLRKQRDSERSNPRSAPVVTGRQQRARARQLDRRMRQLLEQQSRQRSDGRQDSQTRPGLQAAAPALRSSASRQSAPRDISRSRQSKPPGNSSNNRRDRAPSASAQRSTHSEPSPEAARLGSRGSSAGRDPGMRQGRDSRSARLRIQSRVRDRDQR